MLQLSAGSAQPTILASVRVDVPHDLPDDSSYQAWLRGAIQSALREHPFRGRSVIASLGPGEFQMKNIRLPPMPPEELGLAVEFEAAERFGFGADKAEYRHLNAGQVRQGNETREEVIVFAVGNELIQRRIALLEEIRLEPLALDLTPCAMARSFMRFLRRTEDEQAVHVFVDVGRRSTGLVVTRGTQICFAKLIDVGGRAFTRAVAERLDLPYEEAHRLRLRRIGAAASGRTEPAPDDLPEALSDSMSEAVRSLLQHLSREIHLAMRYFTVTFRGHRPECMTFVGGEAHEPDLMRILGEGLDIPCTIGDPLRGLGGSSQVGHAAERWQRPAWAVAVGLSLHERASRRPSAAPPDAMRKSGALRASVAAVEPILTGTDPAARTSPAARLPSVLSAAAARPERAELPA